jgi:hypothetical protein
MLGRPGASCRVYGSAESCRRTKRRAASEASSRLWLLASALAVALAACVPAGADLTWRVTSTGLVGDSCDYAIDPSGNASIAYSTTGYPSNLLYNAGPLWSATTADTNHSSAWQCDLAYSPAGDPGIAHVGGALSSRSRYAYRSGGTWYSEWLPATKGQYPSLGYTSAGNAAISYINSSYANGMWMVEYAERTGLNTWTTQTVASARYSAVGMEASLGFIPLSGAPAVAYLYGFDVNSPMGSRTTELRYAYRSAGNWISEVVDDSSTFVGYGANLAFSPDGQAAICYQDSSTNQLKYAWQRGPNDWVTEVVDAQGYGGSLDFLADGRPAIAYGKSGDAMYALRGASGWQTETVGAGLSGYNMSLNLTAGGLSTMVFRDSSYNIYYAEQLAPPTPELSSGVLVLVSVMPAGLAWCRRRRRR